MLRTMSLVPLFCAALSSAVIAAPVGNDMAGANTPAGKVAVAWIEKAFNEGKMGEAFDLYVSRTDYKNHSGPTGIGPSFEEQKAAEIKALVPNAHFEIVHVIAQGDLVSLHIHVTHTTNSRESELAEFMRVRNGKIVDHWDLHIPVGEGSKQFVDAHRFGG